MTAGEEEPFVLEQILQAMLELSRGNLHDIDHFLKVWAYARSIGRLEGLDDETQLTLEIAALVHDIACPLCREKYGNTAGRHQEREGGPMAEAFLAPFGLPRRVRDRVRWLVEHHHTFTDIQGQDYQILLEADYMVNAGESGYARTAIERFRDQYFRTGSGKAMLDAVYLRQA